LKRREIRDVASLFPLLLSWERGSTRPRTGKILGTRRRVTNRHNQTCGKHLHQNSAIKMSNTRLLLHKRGRGSQGGAVCGLGRQSTTQRNTSQGAVERRIWSNTGRKKNIVREGRSGASGVIFLTVRGEGRETGRGGSP